MQIFRSVVLSIILAAIISCDAPHLNPLDPLNAGYNYGQISGSVVDENSVPISKVKIIFSNSQTVAETNASGNFQMNDVPLRDGFLYYEKAGFENDTVEIKWNNQKNKNVGQKILYSTIGQIEGTVVNPDKGPIAGAKVIFKKTYITETDGLGQFELQNLPLSDGFLSFEKEGYAKDSIAFTWGGLKLKNIGQKTLAYTIGQLEGIVYNSDQLPVNGVKVIFNNGYVSFTDGTGIYRLYNLPMIDGVVHFEKEGFKKDSVQVKWSGVKIKNLGPKTLTYAIGQLEGTVYNTDQLPIQGVKVIFNNTYVSYTDGAGIFRITNVPISDGIVRFEKDGYKNDSSEVKWAEQKIKNIGAKTIAYSIGNIEGFVFNAQRIGINNAKLVFRNTYITQSNSAGQFKLSNIPMVDGWMSVEKNGFAKDSIFVQWIGEKTKRYEIKLNYISGFLDGYVKQDVNHNLSLSGVRVHWKNQNIITYTDNSGYYKFENLPYNNGMLYFEKAGYNKDSVLVQWSNSNESVRVNDRFMNALPVLNSSTIYSTVKNELGGIQRNSMTIETDVTDVDDYIDSVIVKCTEIGFNKRLRYNPNYELYEHTEENMISVEQAVGKNFEIIVKDKSKRVYNVGTTSVKRVISQVLSYISPTDREEVGTQPTFTWKRFVVGFNFKYKFQIFTTSFEDSSKLEYEQPNISQDEIQHKININLKAGNYYWVIWCVDDFKNSARSEPASFTVK